MDIKKENNKLIGSLYYYEDWIEKNKPIPWLILDSKWRMQNDLIEEQITDELKIGMKVEYEITDHINCKAKIIKFID